jgi:predicted PurR-regulated permease PerM
LSNQENKEPAAPGLRAAADAVGPPTRVVLRLIFIVLGVGVVLWVVVKLTGVILLLVLSIFFAYLVSPLVDFIRRPRTVGSKTIAIPRTVAIILSYLVILGAIVLAVFVILPSVSSQFPEFTAQAKSYWKTLGERSQQLNEYFRSRRIPDPVVDTVNHQVPIVIERISAKGSEIVTASLAYLVGVDPDTGLFLTERR